MSPHRILSEGYPDKRWTLKTDVPSLAEPDLDAHLAALEWDEERQGPKPTVAQLRQSVLAALEWDEQAGGPKPTLADLDAKAAEIAAREALVTGIGTARGAAAALWRSQPVATRAKYGTLYTTIVDAFDRGDIEAALYILNAASVDAEEAALKQQFLALFA